MDAVKTTSLGTTKRRILERLKRADATVAELAARSTMTEAGVRQHLDALAENGMVVSRTRPSAVGAGRRRCGRSPISRRICSPIATTTSPSISSPRCARRSATKGCTGSSTRAPSSSAPRTTRAMPKRGSLRARAEALARVRADEGYLAEVIDDPDGHGVLLVEHHCPICTAATACAGLCSSELELFRKVLGPQVSVERTQHLLAGDRRCAYRIDHAR